MTNDWLYPLSSKADYYFDLGDGRTLNTGPASFEEMIQHGGTDHDWGANKNWRNAVQGDRVWAYYGTADGDLGIVGLGRVDAVAEPRTAGGRATLHLTWDVDTTLRLVARPFAATKVRKFIPRPQGPVWRMPPTLARQVIQHAEAKATPSQPMGRYGQAGATTISYTPPRRVSVTRRHDALLRPLEIRLLSARWRSEPVALGTKRADLVMSRGDDRLLVEAKTISGSSNDAVRAAFAQLVEYAWLDRQQGGSAAPFTKWALFESAPTATEIEFLEHHEVMVTWAVRSSRVLRHGPRTATAAPRFGL